MLLRGARKYSIAMYLPVIFLSLSWLFQASGDVSYPMGDIRNCLTSQPAGGTASSLLRMEVLPGIGFDNLRNKDMGQAMAYNYSLCKTTNDGRYLIPDDTFVIPVQRSNFEAFGEYFDHWDSYTSMTSFSVNTDISAFSVISGKFSTEYQHVKQHQVNNQAKTTRVQVRENLYTVKSQPSAQLSKDFKNRLLDIGASLQSNDTDYAIYSAEMLIRDYGTHVITSVEAGALLAQIDSVSSQYVSDQEGDYSSIGASASASFFKKFSFGVGFDVTTSETQLSTYTQSRYHSQVTTIGGPPYKTNMTVNDWEQGVPNALVAIDRAGDPIHFLITPETLPELPEPMVYDVMDLVYSAVKRYYKVNTHYGCTNLNSPNFRYKANVDDGSCEAPTTSFQFGGVFQTCQVSPLQNYEDLCTNNGAQVNPLTGKYSCPNGYEAIQLHSGTITHTSKKEVCNNQCQNCGFMGWSRCCQCVNTWVNILSSANYQAYWCVDTGNVPPNTGYMFGGLYTTSSTNPKTQAKSCPNYFFPLHLGYEMEVCVSDNYDLAYESSVPFGGFFSCQANNPLSAANSSSPSKSCPYHYSSILASVDQGCEINYCAKLQDTYGVDVPRLPPFRSKPALPANKTETLVIMGAYGELWVKNENGDWTKKNTHQEVDTGEELLSLLFSKEAGLPLPNTQPPAAATPSPAINTSCETISHSSDNGLSAGAIAGITIAATILAATTIVVLVFGVYYSYSKRNKKLHYVSKLSYTTINEDHQPTPEQQLIVKLEADA